MKDKTEGVASSSSLLDGINSKLESLADRLIIKTSFEDYLQLASEDFDRFVLKTEKANRISFKAGQIVLALTTPNTVTVSGEFYFIDPEEKILLKKRMIDMSSEHFTDWETSPICQQLRESGKIEYPFDKPKKTAPKKQRGFSGKN